MTAYPSNKFLARHKSRIVQNTDPQVLLKTSSLARTTAQSQAEPWPLVLLPLKLMAKPFDRGAGDIIARVIGPIGGDAFKKWYKRIFGKDCGCGTRQETLNQRWPLGF